MGLILKDRSDIENIIESYSGKEEKIVKVAQDRNLPLGYSEAPNKDYYESYIKYIKDYIQHIRLNNSGPGNYFGKEEFSDKIINNYGKYAYKKK